MKKLTTIFFLLTSLAIQAQETSGYFYGQDLFKFSQYTNYGTARVQGMGGSFVALGADASSAMINPAGLGFYNKNEFSISPFFNSINTSANYLNQDRTRNSGGLGIGQASVVFSKQGVGSRKKRRTFAISYNTLVNFQNEYEYNGINNVSSVQDFFAEQANFRGASPEELNNEFNSSTGVADSQEALYYQAFMIEPTGNGYVVFEPSLPVDQLGRVTENGNLGQLNLSFANNFDDKSYVGINVGIQSLNYNKIDYIDEFFENAEFLNGLRSTNELAVQGTGINIGIGGIYRATEDLNIGLSLTSPTFMGIRETALSTISISPNGDAVETSFTTINTSPNEFNYRMTSPLRANVGGAYFLPNRIGVINAEVEYVGYGRMGIKSKEFAAWTAEQQSAINQVYNDAINFKIGGEVRLGPGRVRAGYNRLGDALAINDGVDRSLSILTAGAGVRFKRFFADFAVNSVKSQYSFTPYELVNETDYSSVLIDSRKTTLSLSLGTFF